MSYNPICFNTYSHYFDPIDEFTDNTPPSSSGTVSSWFNTSFGSVETEYSLTSDYDQYQSHWTESYFVAPSQPFDQSYSPITTLQPITEDGWTQVPYQSLHADPWTQYTDDPTRARGNTAERQWLVDSPGARVRDEAGREFQGYSTDSQHSDASAYTDGYGYYTVHQGPAASSNSNQGYPIDKPNTNAPPAQFGLSPASFSQNQHLGSSIPISSNQPRSASETTEPHSSPPPGKLPLRPLPRSVGSSVKSTMSWLACPDCGQLFTREYDMRRHQRNVHGKWVLQCCYCDYYSPRKDKMGEHCLKWHKSFDDCDYFDRPR